MAVELQQTDLQEDINRQPTAGEMQLAVTHLNSQPSAENFWNGTLVQMPRNPNDQVNDQVNPPQLTENEEKVFYLIKELDQVNDQLTTGYIAQKLGLSYSTIQRILRVLKQKNLVRHVGSDKTGFWQVL